MICSIILRIPNKLPETLYTSFNFREALNEFENIALDEISRLGGECSRKIIKSIEQIKDRGFYCVSTYNRLAIFQKMKNGWFVNGELRFLKEFELIYCKIPNTIINDRLDPESWKMNNDEVEHIFETFLKLLKEKVNIIPSIDELK